MKIDTLKKAVISGYSKLAEISGLKKTPSLFACCDTKEYAKLVGEKIGYSNQELSSVPQEANLGVGCGNPSALANIQKGDTVVDLGSGAGFDAFLVSKQVGETGKVIGVDLSESMLDLANKNAKKGEYVNTDFILGDIEKMPLEENLADHIISNCVINLSTQKQKVFSEAFRVLKKGGQLSISDIVIEEELPAFIKDSLAGHIACVSGAEKIEDYLQYIKLAGFKEIKIESKKSFPLELMLLDPQIKSLAKEMEVNMNSKQAKDLASKVVSISVSAVK